MKPFAHSRFRLPLKTRRVSSTPRPTRVSSPPWPPHDKPAASFSQTASRIFVARKSRTPPRCPRSRQSHFLEVAEALAAKTLLLPLLVNASFNLFGEPLVITPRDAVRSYFCSGVRRAHRRKLSASEKIGDHARHRPKSPKRHPWRRRFWTAAAILLVFTIAAIILARGAGRWLFRPDPLSHADVIVVLSGGLPFRAEGAADVYQQGYAPLVWITKPTDRRKNSRNSASTRRRRGIQSPGRRPSRPPEEAVQILPGEIKDTSRRSKKFPRPCAAPESAP